jgi:hypothetical protein
MKKLVVAMTAIMFLLLASPLAASAYSNSASTAGSNSPNALQLSIPNGVITSAGNQLWSFSGGNLVGAATLGGNNFNPTSPHIKYALSAEVDGLTASGSFSLSMTGVDQNGNQISYQVQGLVVGYIPSFCFPSYLCLPTDTSGIPAFFEVALPTGNGQGETSAQATQMLMVETPIMNPFGGPIVIMSTDTSGIPDGQVQIVVTYDRATAVWENVELAGSLSGNYGSTAVSGGFVQSVNARENFVSGTEQETGSIAFVQMTPSTFDSAGTFTGHSKTPTTGVDCSSTLGLPPGTCLETGLNSDGSFQLTSAAGMTMNGKYAIVWPAPAVVFGGSITAHVHTEGQGQGNQNGQGGNN